MTQKHKIPVEQRPVEWESTPKGKKFMQALNEYQLTCMNVNSTFDQLGRARRNIIDMAKSLSEQEETKR